MAHYAAASSAPESPPRPQDQMSSCDPRWQQPFSFSLIERGNVDALLQHYRASAQYWQAAYIEAYSAVLSFSEHLQDLSNKVDSLECSLRQPQYRATTRIAPARSSGNLSPATPQAMTNDLLTPMEPAWLK